MKKLSDAYIGFEDDMSYNTLWRACRDGIIPCQKVKRGLRVFWYVEPEDIKVFVDKKKEEVKHKFD